MSSSHERMRTRRVSDISGWRVPLVAPPSPDPLFTGSTPGLLENLYPLKQENFIATKEEDVDTIMEEDLDTILNENRLRVERDLARFRETFNAHDHQVRLRPRRDNRQHAGNLTNDDMEAAQTTSLHAKRVKLQEKLVADLVSAARAREELEVCKADGVAKDDVISQQNETLVMLKTSLNEEKDKNTAKDDLNLQLTIKHEEDKAAAAQLKAANVELAKENGLKETVIAGLNAKIAMGGLNGQEVATIAHFEQAALLSQKIIAGLEAQVALAAPKAWF